ncbi:TRAP transporter small permease subunit [Algihabitans albus]|uniref:TRAP transporter small permease subunit n=1 Tax=Algihabitans albus TaxID=2164067 RepID=UPI000E5D5A25|nr:TRAP transporter small permease subunit [Algihabitans albus]
MRVLSRYVDAVTALNDRVGRLSAYLVIPIFFLLLLEVGLRYLAGSPTVWTNELAQMLFGTYVLLAGGFLLAHGGHANVDILHGRLPPRLRAAVDVLTSTLLFAFVGALLYFSSSMAWESVGRLEHSMSAWNPPVWPLRLLIPIAATLLLLQGLAKLIIDLQALFSTAPPHEPQATPAEDAS